MFHGVKCSSFINIWVVRLASYFRYSRDCISLLPFSIIMTVWLACFLKPTSSLIFIQSWMPSSPFYMSRHLFSYYSRFLFIRSKFLSISRLFLICWHLSIPYAGAKLTVPGFIYRFFCFRVTWSHMTPMNLAFSLFSPSNARWFSKTKRNIDYSVDYDGYLVLYALISWRKAFTFMLLFYLSARDTSITNRVLSYNANTHNSTDSNDFPLVSSFFQPTRNTISPCFDTWTIQSLAFISIRYIYLLCDAARIHLLIVYLFYCLIYPSPSEPSLSFHLAQHSKPLITYSFHLAQHSKPLITYSFHFYAFNPIFWLYWFRYSFLPPFGQIINF